MSTEHLASLIEEELQRPIEEAPQHPSGTEPPSAVLRVSRPVRLTNRQKDLVRALACVMWADGNASPQERRIIEQIIEELRPRSDERTEMTAWLDADCSTLDDVQLERLSDDEKQILLSHAVVLAMADDVQLPTEKKLLGRIVERLALPDEVVRTIFEDAREDGAVSLPGSMLQDSAAPPLPRR